MKRFLYNVIVAAGVTGDYANRQSDCVEAHASLIERLVRDSELESLTLLSSTRVYANNHDTDEKTMILLNSTSQDDFYSLSKMLGECIALNNSKFPVKVLRVSNVVSNPPTPKTFLGSLVRDIRLSKTFQFRTSKESARDFICMQDFLSLSAQVILGSHTGVFNVASGFNVTNARIATLLQSKFGVTCSYRSGAPSRAFAPVVIRKVRELFGFEPTPPEGALESLFKDALYG